MSNLHVTVVERGLLNTRTFANSPVFTPTQPVLGHVSAYSRTREPGSTPTRRWWLRAECIRAPAPIPAPAPKRYAPPTMGVAINPPKSPVTEGSNGVAAATLPNVCKMPGPPAPFVPTPLPNIGKSNNSPKGYSASVKIEGNAVAIQGATFNSMGDVASQGTGGGIVSSNVQGPTSFIGPGSLDVRIEGKAVQLLGDQMLNNGGPSGSPANSATMGGLIQAPEIMNALVNSEAGKPQCTGGARHTWEAHEAAGSPSLDRKMADAASSDAAGVQFEAAAADHNRSTGELTRSSQLSGAGDKVEWICSICGAVREGDQLHDGDTPGAAPKCVEVKSTPQLDQRGARQLSRNMQAVAQGGASALVYKVPAGSSHSILVGQLRQAGEMFGCPIQIVRV